jgi:hypothetical protein
MLNTFPAMELPGIARTASSSTDSGISKYSFTAIFLHNKLPAPVNGFVFADIILRNGAVCYFNGFRKSQIIQPGFKVLVVG